MRSDLSCVRMNAVAFQSVEHLNRLIYRNSSLVGTDPVNFVIEFGVDDAGKHLSVLRLLRLTSDRRQILRLRRPP
jgi:hypothetical protein